MRDDWRIRVGAVALFLAEDIAADCFPGPGHFRGGGEEVKNLRAKQFPPRQIGNPAAGSAYGSGQDKREFFRRCVANGGNIEVSPPVR